MQLPAYIIKPARILLLLYIALLLIAWFGYRWIAFPTYMLQECPPAPDHQPFTTSDGLNVMGKWSPLEDTPTAPVLLFCHGNAEHIEDIEPLIRTWNQRGFHVFTFDYRGYGLSEGHPSESGLYRDVEAAYDHLINHLSLAPDRIIPLGRSIGGGPACHLASTKPVGGLILESTFTSLFRVPVPIPVLPIDRFRNLAKIQKVTAPVLVVHGELDTLIKIRHGERLFEKANEPKQFIRVPDAGHNDLYIQTNWEVETEIREAITALGWK